MQTKADNPNKHIVAIALPLFFSNISPPLTGLVDTAIIGHLSHAYYLGAIAIGSAVISMLYWLCGFLRMSTTGVIAQASVNPDKQVMVAKLQAAIVTALVLAGVILLLQQPIIELSLLMSQAANELSHETQNYLAIRIWGIPAVLINLVIAGFLIGTQQAKKVMLLVILTNLTNLMLDLILVVGLDMKVTGAAIATLSAEYTSLIVGLYWLLNYLKAQHCEVRLVELFSVNIQETKALFSLNSNLFLRALVLQLTLLFITLTAAKLGENYIATNAVLMQFFVLIALGLDAIAHAAEVLTGKAKGLKSASLISRCVKVSTCWSTGLAIVYAMLFYLFGDFFIELITDLAGVRALAKEHLYLMVIMPLVAHWCFLLDGIFVGLTRSQDMRNTMLVSSLIGFFPVYYGLSEMPYTGLWLAFLSFLAMRGITLGYLYLAYQRNGRLVH